MFIQRRQNFIYKTGLSTQNKWIERFFSGYKPRKTCQKAQSLMLVLKTKDYVLNFL